MRALIVFALFLSAGCLKVDLEDRPCASEEDCLEDDVCGANRCLPRVRSAESLTSSALCSELYPADIDLSRAHLFGTLMPVSSDAAEAAGYRVDAMKMAIDEINQVGGDQGKLYATLVCDSTNDAAGAVRFMAEYGEIRAVIGASTSQRTIDAFNGAARDLNVVMMSPSATSPRISNQHPHLWRTAPSDAAQGFVVGGILMELGLERVAVVHINDAYGSGLREVVRDEFCLIDGVDVCRDNRDRFIVRGYETDDEHAAIVADLATLDRDVIVIFAQGASTLNFLNAMEGSALESLPVILGDAANQDLILEAPSGILPHIVGTTPSVADTADYGRFASSFQARRNVFPAPNYTPNTYDAAYLIAYASGASDGSGEGIASALGEVSSGEENSVGPQSFAVNLERLKNGAGFDFHGASGPLNFVGTEAEGDVSMWRVEGGQRVNLGVVYSSEDSTFNLPAVLSDIIE